MNFDNSLFKSVREKSKLKEEKKIGRRKWRAGDRVRCKTREAEFNAIIIGFYECSAIVLQENTPIQTVVNFRNMYDLADGKPLKRTKKSEALTKNGDWQSSYLATDEERRAWYKESRASEKYYNYPRG